MTVPPALQPHATEKAWPLRPELLESAYILHSQLGAPRYLRLAQGILETLEQHNRCECGYCAVADVHTGPPSLTIGKHMQACILPMHRDARRWAA